jgi:hypothetical protein
VLLAQTGHTYDRVSIERWLRQKSPPTDPASNVELRSTATVPNWALRDAVNEWRAANGEPPLEAPECATRRLAGGVNARDGLMGFAGLGAGLPSDVAAFASRPIRVAALGVFIAHAQLLTSVIAAVISIVHTCSRRCLRALGVPPNAAAHVAAFGVLACACGATAACIVLMEGLARGSRLDSVAREVSEVVAPAQNIAWWVGVFSAVWLANGGFVDPIRADAERRQRDERERRVGGGREGGKHYDPLIDQVLYKWAYIDEARKRDAHIVEPAKPTEAPVEARVELAPLEAEPVGPIPVLAMPFEAPKMNAAPVPAIGGPLAPDLAERARRARLKDDEDALLLILTQAL